MNEPVADKLPSTTPVSNAPVVLRIMLATVPLIPGVAGLAVFALVTATF